MSFKQVPASTIKKGMTIVFDGKACVVREVSVGKSGKHGHAKARIEAISILDDQKIIKVMPGGDKIDIPLIEKKTAQVLSLKADQANVMDLESFETFDLKVPEELKDKVIEGVQVIYWIILSQKVIMQLK